MKSENPQFRVIRWLKNQIHPSLEAGAIPDHVAARVHAQWQQLAPATRNAYSSALNRLNRWVCERLQLPKPARFAVPSAGPQRTMRPSEKELRAILARAEPAMRLVLLLCADCGLRTGEARSIAPENWNEQENVVQFKQKGHTVRSVPVTTRVAEMISAAPDIGRTDVPFAQLYFGEKHRFTEAVFHARWRALQKILHLDPRLRVHDFRRRLATRVYEKTKDLRAAQSILGHKSLASTLRYIAPFEPHDLRPLLEELKPKFRKENP